MRNEKEERRKKKEERRKKKEERKSMTIAFIASNEVFT